MTFWIALVLIAQVINAAVSLLDKYIVSSRRVGNPIVLTFYISVLSFLSVGLFAFSWIQLPFASFQIPALLNISTPSVMVVWLTLFIGATFILSLYFLFRSFQQGDASDVVPVVSSINAVFTLLLSFYILGNTIPHNFLWGFLFLVFGTFLIAHFRFSPYLFKMTLASGFLFACHYVALEYLFTLTHFDNAFFWSRIAISVLALVLLLSPQFRHLLRKKQNGDGVEDEGEEKKNGLGLVIFNKILAGLASLLILKAIALGDVSIVQALTGIQFVFLLLFSVLFGRHTTVHIGENVTHTDIVQKTISVVVIVTGFTLLFI